MLGKNNKTMSKKQTNGITIPADTVAVSKLKDHFPQYKTSYIQLLMRDPGAPVFYQAGVKLISISAFEQWFNSQTKRHFSATHQTQKVIKYLLEHTATRAECELILSVHVKNICRIIANLRKTNAYKVVVVKSDICRVTGCKAEYLRLEKIEEVAK